MVVPPLSGSVGSARPAMNQPQSQRRRDDPLARGTPVPRCKTTEVTAAWPVVSWVSDAA